MSTPFVELLGYLATILIAISLSMQNIRYLRWINLLGSIVFTIYGIILHLVPIIVANSFITLANIYYLFRMMLSQEHFLIIPVTSVTSAFLPKFLDFYHHDLTRQFPRFKKDGIDHWRHVFITRDMVPVGLFSYEYYEETEVLIHLDYVIPSYRDYKTARFLFEEFGSMLAGKGFKNYRTYAHSKIYERYLRKMGFQQDSENKQLFTMEI